jgi:hypothetical protein
MTMTVKRKIQEWAMLTSRILVLVRIKVLLIDLEEICEDFKLSCLKAVLFVRI